MGIFHKLLKQSSHYFFGGVIVSLAGFISLPILTRIFSKSQYGIFGLVTITIFILIAFAKLGLQHSSIRFYQEFKTGKRKQDISVFYSTLFWGSLANSILISLMFILGVLVFKQLFPSKMRTVIWLIPPLIISGSMFIRLNNFIRTEQKTVLFNLMIVVRRYSRLGFGLALVFLISKQVHVFYIGVLLAEILIVVFLVSKLFGQGVIKFKSFHIPFLKESVRYGLPLIFLELSSFFLKFSDRYLIQGFLGSAAVGVYTVGANLSQYVVHIVCLPVAYAITPMYMELWTKEGKAKTEKFVSEATNYLIMLTLPIIFGFYAIRKEVVVMLASNKFADASSIIPFILIGVAIWEFYPLFSAGLFIHKKTKNLATIVVFTGFLNVALNIFLIPKMGIVGAAVASLICYIFTIFLIILSSFRYLKVEFYIYRVLRYLAASFFMWLVINWLPFRQHIRFLPLTITIGLFTYSLLILIADGSLREKCATIIKDRRIKKSWI